MNLIISETISLLENRIDIKEFKDDYIKLLKEKQEKERFIEKEENLNEEQEKKQEEEEEKSKQAQNDDKSDE